MTTDTKTLNTGAEGEKKKKCSMITGEELYKPLLATFCSLQIQLKGSKNLTKERRASTVKPDVKINTSQTVNLIK